MNSMTITRAPGLDSARTLPAALWRESGDALDIAPQRV
jgi:hypothetical protein